MRRLLSIPGVHIATLLALAAVLAWDLSGLDMQLAASMGGVHGFPLRNDWLLAHVFHTGARSLAWLLGLALCVAVWWPVGVLREIPASRRLHLAVGTVLLACLVPLLKVFSATSCPWDMDSFGGVAHYVPHWILVARDGGPGHCFPAGHAISGFAFVGGYFAFRGTHPRVAGLWLAGALAAGFALGWVQQLRGAHFMSHTLWSAWICWTAACVYEQVAAQVRWPVRA